MRPVAWSLFLFVGCSASPQPTAEPAAITSGSATEYCFIGEHCVPCAGAGFEMERCQLILGALARSDDGAVSLASPQRPLLRSGGQAPTRPPSLPLPAGRTDATVTTNDPALASAASAYRRLVASPFSLETPPADTSTGIQAIIANIQRASAIAVELGQACEPVEASAGPSRIAALAFHADALDFVASRIATATLPLPIDLVSRAQDASPEVRTEIDRQFHVRIAEVLGQQSRTVYCAAARLYQAVLGLDPTHPRATAQLAAYGDAFVQSCAR